MRPLDLLKTSKVLLSSGKGKPTTASLCRATSSTYYALFHCLAYESANLMIGGVGAERSKPAWRQVYRGLDHGHVRSQCDKSAVMKKFPKSIVDFAETFVTMQKKRHSADYDPFFVVKKSEVAKDVALAEVAIAAFKAAPAKDRRAFCAYVLMKERKT